MALVYMGYKSTKEKKDSGIYGETQSKRRIEI
jgi:hypothetical protein